MESARTHHAFHIQFSPPQDMAVRVSIGGMGKAGGWRPMSWTVAGFEGRRGCNDNADGFGLIVQRGAAGAGQVGGRSAGTEDPRRMDRRFGVKMGVMEGGLFPIIKNSKRKVWLGPLFDGAYAAFHGVLNGS